MVINFINFPCDCTWKWFSFPNIVTHLTCYYHTYKSLFSVLKGRVWHALNRHALQNVLILFHNTSYLSKFWMVCYNNGTPVTDLSSRLFFCPNFTFAICESIISFEYPLSKNHDFISWFHNLRLGRSWFSFSINFLSSASPCVHIKNILSI